MMLHSHHCELRCLREARTYHAQRPVMSSMAAGDALGTSRANGTVAHWGKRKLMLAASLSPSGHVCFVGVPMTVQIL